VEDRRVAGLRERFPGGSFDTLAVSLAVSRASLNIDRQIAELLKPAGLTPLAFQTLIAMYLGDEGPLSLKLLGEELRVTKANMSLVLSSLEKQGLIRRRADRDDGRKIRAWTTKRGESVIEEFLPKVCQSLEDLFEGGLDPSERQVLKRLAERVR